MIVFLVGFIALILLVSDYFLIPAMVAARDATPAQKLELVAWARLMMAIVLLILSIGIIMVFRIRRFFFPKDRPGRQKTEYVDAWREAGRRVSASEKNPE